MPAKVPARIADSLWTGATSNRLPHSDILAQSGSIIVVDEIKLQESKTKLMAQVLKALNASEQKALLVLADRDEAVIRAGKNIPTLKDAYVNTINVYDLLNADKIIVLKGAMQDLQEVYA